MVPLWAIDLNCNNSTLLSKVWLLFRFVPNTFYSLKWREKLLQVLTCVEVRVDKITFFFSKFHSTFMLILAFTLIPHSFIFFSRTLFNFTCSRSLFARRSNNLFKSHYIFKSYFKLNNIFLSIYKYNTARSSFSVKFHLWILFISSIQLFHQNKTNIIYISATLVLRTWRQPYPC